MISYHWRAPCRSPAFRRQRGSVRRTTTRKPGTGPITRPFAYTVCWQRTVRIHDTLAHASLMCVMGITGTARVCHRVTLVCAVDTLYASTDLRLTITWPCDS